MTLSHKFIPSISRPGWLKLNEYHLDKTYNIVWMYLIIDFNTHKACTVKLIDKHHVTHIIKKFNCKTSFGYDGLSTKLLKQLEPILSGLFHSL